MQQQHAIEFFFLAKATSLWEFHWLIEWSTSSFYVKCLHPRLQSAKVSLHGPDPKHPGKQHLRFDLVEHAGLIQRSRDGRQPSFYTHRWLGLSVANRSGRRSA